MAHDIRNLADEEVMQLVQRGDPRAFELLYDRHGGAAFSLAYRIVGKQAAAEDVVQEAFLSIWRSRLRYEPDARERAHLGARHRPQPGDRRAAAQLGRTTAGASAEGIEERYEAPERTDVEVARREEARTVRGALETLPEEQRAGDRAGVLRRLHAHADRRDARRADRHGEGPDAARPREDADGSSWGAWHERDHTRYRDDIGAYLLGALTELERAGVRAPPGRLRRVPRRGRAAAAGGRRAAALGASSSSRRRG